MGFMKKLFWFWDNSIAQIEALQTIFEKYKWSYLVDNIEDTVWEKFVFISAMASATSYLNKNAGEILTSQSGRNLYVSLLNEITMIYFRFVKA